MVEILDRTGIDEWQLIRVWIQPNRVVTMDKITAVKNRGLFSPDQRFMVA